MFSDTPAAHDESERDSSKETLEAALKALLWSTAVRRWMVRRMRSWGIRFLILAGEEAAAWALIELTDDSNT